MAGCLVLCPTPIGNLKDISERTLEALQNADVIAAEDTRNTAPLLSYYGIHTPLVSYHKYNEHGKLESVANRLRGGESVALISDAGTPGISDPGFLIVRECVRLGIDVQCLPGATAVIPALVASGIPCDRFVFEGFLPQKKGRTSRIATLSEETRTMVFYESPYRIVKALTQLAEVMGMDRHVAVCREISKIHEECVRGTLAEAIAHFTAHEPRGEFVIVLAGKPEK